MTNITNMMGLRQFIFIICCASITGLSYLLSYVYIVILTRFVGRQSLFYVSVGAMAQWALSSVLAHFLFILYSRVRRDTVAAVTVGVHTFFLLCLVVGAVVIDQTDRTIDGYWLVFAILSVTVMKIVMELFQVLTIRDWIIEVSDNDEDMLVMSNMWYYILAVTIPGLMTLGGNYLFDLGLGVTGIVLTLGASAILLQLLALAGIIFIIGPMRSNIEYETSYISGFRPISNIAYFFKQSAWELSLGLDVESIGLISFGLFMRLFLAHKGVTPYTISVLMCIQAASAVLSAVFYPAIRRHFNGGIVITICTLGKIIFALVFLFVVLKQKYTSEFEQEIVIITHDSIFIEVEDVIPQDNLVMTIVIMASSVLLAVFSQLDTLFSNQLVQESLSVTGRGRYAGTEFSFKYMFTFIKQVCIATIELDVLFLVMLVLTFVCETLKLFLAARYVLKGVLKDAVDDYSDEIELLKPKSSLQ